MEGVLVVSSIYIWYRNRKNGEICVSRWVSIIDEVAFYYMIVALSYSLFFMIFGHWFVTRLHRLENWIERMRKRSKLKALYKTEDGEKVEDMNKYLKEMNITMGNLDNISLDQEEIEQIKVNTEMVRSEDSILEVYCCLCGEKIDPETVYHELPYCLHQYHAHCFEDMLDRRNSRCVVCDNKVRPSVLKKIHKVKDDYIL